ncbi:hypothetical protein, partial [Snodgrassella alvi]|uniref:hypothetical protein n=1 Tax=Snodgrassella alvi TaxID=1196083 RepID=UPI000A0DC394
VNKRIISENQSSILIFMTKKYKMIFKYKYLFYITNNKKIYLKIFIYSAMFFYNVLNTAIYSSATLS